MHKSRSVYRDGYKAHIAVEPETGLITATSLTPANAGEGPTGVALLADSAYGSGQVRSSLDQAGHTAAIKAIPLKPNGSLRRRYDGDGRAAGPQDRNRPDSGHRPRRTRSRAAAKRRGGGHDQTAHKITHLYFTHRKVLPLPLRAVFGCLPTEAPDRPNGDDLGRKSPSP